MEEKLQTERLWAVTRLRHFIEKLEKATDPLDAEAQLYTIMRTAERSYDAFHYVNENMGVR